MCLRVLMDGSRLLFGWNVRMEPRQYFLICAGFTLWVIARTSTRLVLPAPQIHGHLFRSPLPCLLLLSAIMRNFLEIFAHVCLHFMANVDRKVPCQKATQELAYYYTLIHARHFSLINHGRVCCYENSWYIQGK